MDKKDSPRGSELVKVIRSGSMGDAAKEYVELGIDALLASDAAKSIPVVSTIAGIFSATLSIRDHVFGGKLLRFLSQLSEISEGKRNEMMRKLGENDKFAGRVGERIIEILERIESAKKPELAAKCFAAYASEDISFEELSRILFALERIPSFDIDKIGQFSRAKIEDAVNMDESLLLAFVNAGLGMNNGGFDGGAILPTKLCQLFLKAGLVA
ncbi:hypothetical protein B1219_00820 [Pseudomonas ogarae]|uniref:hypothetical protein n=1 Tax=Pseudomonas ogarae (strain DSM 112162 / CECT 30235 / F113) TaxID=1114970 RepID=UPI0009A38D9B|nr:hypothetical protein [Pseudomonas ogarae]OPG73648.1 hypothetical protein B1219_00820 [Pseudomonas ogarae]OPG78458.1 hypothetical protein B1218_15450 [Pseudomonas ogarae]